jgi:hypothetical protein
MPARYIIEAGIRDGWVNSRVPILGGQGRADRKSSNEQGKIAEGFNCGLKKEIVQLRRFR